LHNMRRDRLGLQHERNVQTFRLLRMRCRRCTDVLIQQEQRAEDNLLHLLRNLPVKERLDKLLFDRGLAKSRQQAQGMILEGAVLVNHQRIDKPGTRVDISASIRLKSVAQPYVSRGGLKLEKALDVFAFDVAGWVCLDIGASTGGFTDCVLQKGAAKVYAVDVGHNQLDWKLRNDERVVPIEGLNARYLKFEDIGTTVDFITVDVSFISLTLILPVLRPFTKPATRIICLVKPQFEVGKEQVESGGLVTDPKKHVQVIEKIKSAAIGLGYRVLAVVESPILGGEGNKEFLLALAFDSQAE
jgi:23S rRNA (cytidine1920-2'-O)/16S rRNA (cytidine1409-2'-O)-methyltransferase